VILKIYYYINRPLDFITKFNASIINTTDDNIRRSCFYQLFYVSKDNNLF
jgi:hypothetical protein